MSDMRRSQESIPVPISLLCILYIQPFYSGEYVGMKIGYASFDVSELESIFEEMFEKLRNYKNQPQLQPVAPLMGHRLRSDVGRHISGHFWH